MSDTVLQMPFEVFCDCAAKCSKKVTFPTAQEYMRISNKGFCVISKECEYGPGYEDTVVEDHDTYVVVKEVN